MCSAVCRMAWPLNAGPPMSTARLCSPILVRRGRPRGEGRTAPWDVFFSAVSLTPCQPEVWLPLVCLQHSGTREAGAHSRLARCLFVTRGTDG
jgi:hypothetical protein